MSTPLSADEVSFVPQNGTCIICDSADVILLECPHPECLDKNGEKNKACLVCFKSFIEKLTSINRGRAFFTTPETLGDYVLVDFIVHKKQLARGRGARRAG